MDELLIEDKKYVSSKRAAKITGYAKDYIGQLCREGRVPARLVGRSWYVLESAIADHRFGDQKSPEELEKYAQTVAPTREAPRYTVPVPENLPVLSREDEVQQTPLEQKISDATQGLQDSWKAWFDRKINQEPALEAVTNQETRQDSEEIKDAPQEESVNIPIHTVYELPPEDLLPRIQPKYSEEYTEIAAQNLPPKPDDEPKTPKTYGKSVIALSIILAIGAVALAVLSTGLFDGSIGDTVLHSLAGVTIYNK